MSFSPPVSSSTVVVSVVVEDVVVEHPLPLQQFDPGQQLFKHLHGWHGVHGTQTGHEQHSGGGGGGGVGFELQHPLLQHVGAQGLGHIHQIVHGLLHEQPEQQLLSQFLVVVVDSVVVVVVVVASSVVVVVISGSLGAGVFPLSLQHPHPLHGPQLHGIHQIIAHLCLHMQVLPHPPIGIIMN